MKAINQSHCEVNKIVAPCCAVNHWVAVRIDVEGKLFSWANSHNISAFPYDEYENVSDAAHIPLFDGSDSILPGIGVHILAWLSKCGTVDRVEAGDHPGSSAGERL